MKIYNKKTFASGAILLLLALANLWAGAHSGFAFKTVLLLLILLLLGTSLLSRSLSQRLSQEDLLQEQDERNQLIQLKTKTQALKLTRTASFLLMLALLIMGKLSGNQSFTGIGVGLAFAYSLSLLTELFSYFYYETRN